ncbi:hypothetical protein Trydic_g22517 [Trypoxylus dichotomus]
MWEIEARRNDDGGGGGYDLDLRFTCLLKFHRKCLNGLPEADEAPAIKESQKLFQDPAAEEDLKSTYNNYIGLEDVIEKSQNSGLLFVDSEQRVDDQEDAYTTAARQHMQRPNEAPHPRNQPTTRHRTRTGKPTQMQVERQCVTNA